MMRLKTLYDRLGGYDAITAVANDLLPRSQASRTAITRSGGPSKGLPYWNSTAFQALTYAELGFWEDAMIKKQCS